MNKGNLGNETLSDLPKTLYLSGSMTSISIHFTVVKDLTLKSPIGGLYKDQNPNYKQVILEPYFPYAILRCLTKQPHIKTMRHLLGKKKKREVVSVHVD